MHLLVLFSKSGGEYLGIYILNFANFPVRICRNNSKDKLEVFFIEIRDEKSGGACFAHIVRTTERSLAVESGGSA